MRAWRLQGLRGDLALREIPEPATRSAAVSVRVGAVPLLSYLRSYVEGGLPTYTAPAGEFTPGINGIGVIEGLGPDVFDLRVGQRVFLSPHLRAAENVPEPAEALLALTAEGTGVELLNAWPDGTLAELVCAPVATVTPVPAELDGTADCRLAALARCVVSYGGLLRAGLAPGQTVVIHGATGAFGSAGVLVALAMGAATVVAAGREPEALARLAKLPRVVTVAMSGDPDRDRAALRAAAGGGADCALDMVGRADSASGTQAVLGALRREGRLVLMGGVTVPLPLDYALVMRSGLEVVGNFMYPRTAPAILLAMTAAGLLDLEQIPLEVFPFDDLPAAMETAEGRQAPLVVVVP
jgi:alcohol dehydrogenase